jgi:hypothetical protein
MIFTSFLSLQCIYTATINQIHPDRRPTNATLARSSSLTHAAAKHRPPPIHAAIASLHSTDSCRTPLPSVRERWWQFPAALNLSPADLLLDFAAGPESDDDDEAYAPAASMGGSSTASSLWREGQRGRGGGRGVGDGSRGRRVQLQHAIQACQLDEGN